MLTATTDAVARDAPALTAPNCPWMEAGAGRQRGHAAGKPLSVI